MTGKGGEEKKAKQAEEEAKPEKEHFINKYGFLHISDKLAEKLSIPKFGKDTGRKVPVKIEVLEDASGFIIRLVK